MQPWTRTATSLLVAASLSGLTSGFVITPPRHAAAFPAASSALNTRSLLPPAQACSSNNSNRGGYLSSRGVLQTCKAVVGNGEERGQIPTGEFEEKEEEAGVSPAKKAAVSASSLAAGSAVVALAAIGGFPDLAAAAAPEWVGPTKLVLDPLLLFFEFAFVARIILSWYPALDLNSAPQNLVAWPTEPILKPTRAVVPPAFGVDISPIVWVMICTFLHEILLGQQGILNLISNK